TSARTGSAARSSFIGKPKDRSTLRGSLTRTTGATSTVGRLSPCGSKKNLVAISLVSAATGVGLGRRTVRLRVLRTAPAGWWCTPSTADVDADGVIRLAIAGPCFGGDGGATILQPASIAAMIAAAAILQIGLRRRYPGLLSAALSCSRRKASRTR